MSSTTPALVIGSGKDGVPHWEAKWRSGGRQMKRRIPDGPAWAKLVDVDGGQRWRAKDGRPTAGKISRTRAVVLAAQLAARVAAEIEADEREKAAGLVVSPPTFRKVAHEWLVWLRDVKGAKPSTLRDYSALLREPGHKFARGKGESPGRIMLALGDRDVREITTREVSDWLKALDAEGLTPRNVNKHRQLVQSVLTYAMRDDTYALLRNVAANTDKRREQAPAALDYYEPHEVEALAQAVAAGQHRGTQPKGLGMDERLMRAEEDVRDADFFRILLYTGMRLSELRALRWPPTAGLGPADLPGLHECVGPFAAVARPASRRLGLFRHKNRLLGVMETSENLRRQRLATASGREGPS